MRKIIHIDMDAYFANVEIRDNPAYKDIPIAIGGMSDRRGVIATCNYIARQYGVRSAMSSYKAMQLCPDLTLVPSRMQVYKEVSAQLHEIFSRYTDLIEPLSLDEAYLDVTDCELFSGSATLIAEDIRKSIESELALTASAGVAPVKFLAKVASDINKPNGLFVITPSQVKSFVADLPLNKIPGVGKVTWQKLNRVGLYTCADVLKFPPEDIIESFGKLGHSLLERCQGIDNRPVCNERHRKSVGVEITLPEDIVTLEQCMVLFPQLYQTLLQRLEKASPEMRITKQGVKLKFNDFTLTSTEQSITNLDEYLFTDLFAQALTKQEQRGIRLIGLYVGLAGDNDSEQYNLLF
ncbi:MULTISPECIES: DNA polymerase IV [unclassified Moritella]|uniref:DNA polymerase IV n=1 Tax=unclassified Moritella TaxID=2637987 RepID=UPI001BA57577|nr:MULTISPECIES: DNA polymerase IV [unclassified Moritella]QUM82215.1 DNA polymerase IV [Moritella sp. 5]QUM86515.1 DNA polymerase IV [Moritella sp. 28]QUM90741.1 DNA polymerase IV [Moritella sp. 36]